MDLYNRIGGQTRIQALVNEFYDVMEREAYTRPLRDVHPQKLHSSRRGLTKYLCQWFGGPALYGEAYINAEWLELRHRRLDLTAEEQQQWLYCMNQATLNLDLDEQLRENVVATCATMIDAMVRHRNSRKTDENRS